MARQMIGQRKQRTRQHIIADLSVHHVEGLILLEGHTAQRLEKDYGYDLLLMTFDEDGYAEPDFLRLQLKAAESLRSVRAGYVFDLDIRDYNLWMLEMTPVILILFDAGRRKAYWLHIQQYFREDPARWPPRGAKQIRVHVPKQQLLSRRAIATLRELKAGMLGGPMGGET